MTVNKNSKTINLRKLINHILFVLIYFSFVIQSRLLTLTKQFVTNSFTDGDIITTWTIAGSTVPSSHLFYLCNDTLLVGGYKIFTSTDQVPISIPNSISKIFNTPVKHYAINIKLKIYKIDSWVNQSIFVIVDGISYYVQTFISSSGATQLCGQVNPILNSINSNYKETVSFINITINHTSTTMNLTLASNLNNDKGSWGFRQLQITTFACEQTCQTCNSSSLCTSCDSSIADLAFTFPYCKCQTLFTQKNQYCTTSSCFSCQIDCITNPGYYQNGTYCLKCNVACATCTDSLNSGLSCQSCATGYWRSLASQACSKCFKGCASCNGLSSNQCLSCQIGYFYFSNQCILGSCPTGYYGLQSSKQCFACISPCLTCNGGTTNYCLSCIVSRYLYMNTCLSSCPAPLIEFNWACVTQCPIKTYLNTIPIIHQCVSCMQYCKICTNGTVCIQCQSLYFLMSGICISTCPSNYYPYYQYHSLYPSIITLATCFQCHTSCLTCSSFSEYDCNSCNPSQKLYKNMCINVCPLSTFTTILSCQQCNQTCLTCFGSLDSQCLSCQYGRFYHLNLSKCLYDCIIGDIVDNQKYQCYTCIQGQVNNKLGQCVKCSKVCSTCYSTTFYSCLSCNNLTLNATSSNSNVQEINIKLINNTCVLQSDNRILRPPIIWSPSNVLEQSQQQSAISLQYLQQQLQSKLQPLINITLLCIIVNALLSIIIEIVFTYKSNLIIFIEFLQYLSYFYYITFPFSISLQKLFLYLYYSHITYFIPYSLITSLIKIANLQTTNITSINQLSIPTKMTLNQKTGIYFIDTLFIHIVFLFVLAIFLIVRALNKFINSNSNNKKPNKKYIKSKPTMYLYSIVYPYLITYTFRILSLELFLSMVLYLSSVNFSKTFQGDGLQIISFILIIVDIVIFSFSFLWKIKVKDQNLTSNQNNNNLINHQQSAAFTKQYALIYYNQLGQPIKSSFYGIENDLSDEGKQQYKDGQIEKQIINQKMYFKNINKNNLSQNDKSHQALYINQDAKSNIMRNTTRLQSYEKQISIQKSVKGVIIVVPKILFCLLLVIFAQNPFSQILSLLLFFIIVGVVHFFGTIQYRRRIFRVMTWICLIIFILITVLILIMQQSYIQGKTNYNYKIEVGIMIIICMIIGIFAIINVMQIILNWEYFIRFIKWLCFKIKVKIIICCYKIKN